MGRRPDRGVVQSEAHVALGRATSERRILYARGPSQNEAISGSTGSAPLTVATRAAIIQPDIGSG